MGDYIERQDAIDAIGKAMPKPSTPDFKGVTDYEAHIACEAFADSAMIIEDLPAANVREDMRSNWVEEISRKPFLSILYKCEKCGYLVDRVRNFCPECGADMREE